MRTINLSSIHSIPWLRQFPNGIPEWNGWRFIFNAENEEYDYLVAFDDLHAPVKPNCPPENIIHLSTEPPLARQYDDTFLSQFAWTIRQGKKEHREGAIFHQPGLNWRIGWTPDETKNNKTLEFFQIKSLFDTPKTKLISVSSSDIRASAQHQARLRFAQRLKKHYGSKIDFFGRGFTPMDDKITALKDYRFHVVLENSAFDHYFSEKLSDCILAGAYPIYYGCPNVDEYFPKHSYQSINIHNFDTAISVINNAIENDYDIKFRQELLNARDLVLNKHNIFPMLVNIIGNIEEGKYGSPKKLKIMPLGQDTSKLTLKKKIQLLIRWKINTLIN